MERTKRQLEALMKLDTGWVSDDPDSLPPSKELCHKVEEFLNTFLKHSKWREPSLFATSWGGIDALWRFPTHTVRFMFHSDFEHSRYKHICMDTERVKTGRLVDFKV